VFTGIVLLLTVTVFLEQYSQQIGNVVLGTVSTSIGYIFRPVLIYIFILLANMEHHRPKKFHLILASPLFLNLIIYLLPLFFGVQGVDKVVFYYRLLDNGTAKFERGTFLNFTSHAVCFAYIFALIYVSVLRFSGKHRRDAAVLVLCIIFILTTVITEMITEKAILLNTVCEICLMINYIFIISVNTSKDPLTGLYDRRAYYEDISRFEDLVNGVIQIDMNELKYLNDNFGHEAGDEALKAIADIFDNSISRATMCVYRLSGDEFLVLMFQGKKNELDNTAELIKKRIKETKYSVAIGSYFYEKADNITFEEAMKKAEELMYQDKTNYYVTSGHNRRKN
jgi:diguanylate cyclase (GGDEF)-like protein